MAVSNSQKGQVRKFVAANYAPKLRKPVLDKFLSRAMRDGNINFITTAGKKKAPSTTPKVTTPKTAKPAAPVDPYARYKALGPGPAGTLSFMDRSQASHQAFGNDVAAWLKGVITPMQGAGAAAAKGYAEMGSQAAQMGALPNQMPQTQYGGGLLSAGGAQVDINAAGAQGQAASAAGTQAAGYQGFLADIAGRDLATGISSTFAGSLAQLPGQYNQAKLEYMQKLDQNLFELEAAQAEQQAQMQLEEMKLANDRYTARLGLVGQLTGTDAKLQLGQLSADTKVATSSATNASRERVAEMNNATKQAIAASNNQLKAAKLRADKAKGTATQKQANTALLHQVQIEFDKLWTGEAPDPLMPGSGHGWRYTARSRDKATREKASYQVLSWLASTGLPPAHLHKLFRSKGFSDAEFQRAVRRVEGGGGTEPVAQTPTKQKKSALLRYALGPNVRGPALAPRHGKGGINLRPTPTRGAATHLSAPNTGLGTYANRLIAPRLRLPSIQYPGQIDPTLTLAGAPQAGVGGGGGSWFQNLGKDALSIVTGVPASLALAGRTLASPATAAYGYGGGLVGAPGSGAARRFTVSTGRDLKTAGAAVAQDYKTRWGPLVEAGSVMDLVLNRDNSRADLRRFGGQIEEHPGFFALDVATIASLGQAGAVRGAAGASAAGRSLTRARFGKMARGVPIFPSNTPPPRSTILRDLDPRAPSKVAQRQPVGKVSQQGPGRLERMLTDPEIQRLADSRKLANRTRTRSITQSATVREADGGLTKLELPTKSVALRPYSAQPMTRWMQKKFDTKVLGGLERISEKRGKGGYMSTPRRDARALGKEQRGRTVRWESARDQATHETTREFARTVLYKRGISKDKRAEALVALRVDNVAVAKPGRTAMEGVEQYLKEQQRRLDDDAAAGVPEEALAAHRANVELVRSIPREMIETPPRAVVEGAEEARKMLAASQDIRGKTGGIYGISGETRARADLYREAVQTGQARFFDDVGGLMNPERRQKMIDEGYEHVALPDVARALRTMYTGGPLLGRRGASAAGIARAEELIKSGVLPKPGPGSEHLLQGSNLNAAVVRGIDKLFAGKVPLNKAGNIHTGVVTERIKRDSQLRNTLQDPGNLFRPGEKPAGGGVYRGSTAVGYASGHRGGSKSTFGFGELGRADKQTTGRQMGRDSLSRESMMQTAQKSINAMYTQKSVRETIQQFALRAEGGTKPYALRTADAVNGLDPEMWTVVSVRELEKLVDELSDLQPGQSASSLSSFANKEQILRRLSEGDESAVALPKPLVDEIKQTIDDPHGLMKRYDKVLDVWRAGILAYTPRWFVNNLVGTSIFLGVLSGLDIRAFLQAGRNKRFFQEHVVPFESESVSHSYAIGAADKGRGGLEPQARTRFMRGAHQMFLLNQRLEGRLRRTAYITRAKQNLRTEGRLRGRNYLQKLSDDELFDAMVKMPDDLKVQTLKDMEFFVGRYKSYGKLEKRVLRRIIPFYSWLRVINTWAFGLPFKSPLRAEAVRIATTMGYALSESTDGLPLWEKGRFTFGNFAIRTNNINPLYSVAEEISGLTGAHNPSAGLTDLIRVAGGSMSPPLQIAIAQISGRNPFGTRDFSVPAGYGDTSASFGSGPMRRNPVTGEIEHVKPAPALWEQAFDSMIPFMGPVKTALAGQRQPYDTSSALDLVGGKLGLLDEDTLYQPPPKTPSGRGRLPAGLSPALGLLGAPAYTVDRKQELLSQALAEARLAQSERDTARLLMREKLRRVMDVRSR